MSVGNLNNMIHPPEVVVSFVRRLLDVHRAPVESERRAQRRDSITIPVKIQPLDSRYQSTGISFCAVTKDISTGGIGLIHTDAVDSTFLQIEISSDNGETMSLLAQVKNCTPFGKCYHIGAQFVVDWSSWRQNDTGGNTGRERLPSGNTSVDSPTGQLGGFDEGA